MVENVLNSQGTIVGYVLAGIDISIINNGLQSIRSIPGYIEFRQEFSGSIHLLGAVGETSLKQGDALNISSLENSLWQIAYWPAPEEDFTAGDEQFIFIIGLLSIFLLISIFGFIGFKRISDTLENDASKLVRLILENPDSKVRIHKGSFVLRIFYDMAYTVQRTSNERMAKRKANDTRVHPEQQTNPVKRIQGNEMLSPPDNIPKSVEVSSNIKEAAVKMLEDNEELEIENETSTSESISSSIFRAYDIRGIVGETLTTDTVRWIGLAIGSEAFERGEQTIIVGRDGRNSGPELIEALKEGLMASGRDVIDIGMVPTPLLYFATHYLESGSGVMLTGSHNPAEYNGLKIVLAGDSLHSDEITELYNRIRRRDLLTGEGTETSNDIIIDYIDNITGDISLAQPLKIVIDAGNGIAGSVAPILFKALGCEVIPLHCELNGNFPNHHPDPSKPENLTELQEVVIKEEADIGIAFDGDGDRLGVVDSSSKIIWPDRQMMLFSKDVLSRHPGADVIFDVKCSRHLQKM
ncbi:MAG: phosphomannomutase/phosphoglucomutase, partial [Gammaproteobacteria bacterium]|nr:phosphomannomutase/phosphoglucomutase [Gammaproteobacteria bacterium]